MNDSIKSKLRNNFLAKKNELQDIRSLEIIIKT